MFLLYQFGTLVARFRARKMQAAGQADDEEEALGGGDVYLAGVLGLMLGWHFIGMPFCWVCCWVVCSVFSSSLRCSSVAGTAAMP